MANNTKAPKPKLNESGLRVLRLGIKRKFLDEIIAGTKTEEFRDDTPHYGKLLCTFDANGDASGFREYDLIHFQVERNKDGFWAEVAIEEIYAEEYLDPDTGEDTGTFYFAIKLGEVLAVKTV